MTWWMTGTVSTIFVCSFNFYFSSSHFFDKSGDKVFPPWNLEFNLHRSVLQTCASTLKKRFTGRTASSIIQTHKGVRWWKISKIMLPAASSPNKEPIFSALSVNFFVAASGAPELLIWNWWTNFTVHSHPMASRTKLSHSLSPISADCERRQINFRRHSLQSSKWH